MQCDNATIKQSGHDKMHQVARYNDEARQNAMMQRCDDSTTQQLNDDERDDERQDAANDMAWRCNGKGCDDKGQRDDATTNKMNKQMDKRTNKAGAT